MGVARCPHEREQLGLRGRSELGAPRAEEEPRKPQVLLSPVRPCDPLPAQKTKEIFLDDYPRESKPDRCKGLRLGL